MASDETVRLLNRREAREIIPVSESGLDRLIRDGELPIVKVRGRVFVASDDVVRFIEERRTRKISRSDEGPAAAEPLVSTNADDGRDLDQG